MSIKNKFGVFAYATFTKSLVVLVFTISVIIIFLANKIGENGVCIKSVLKMNLANF